MSFVTILADLDPNFALQFFVDQQDFSIAGEFYEDLETSDLCLGL